MWWHLVLVVIFFLVGLWFLDPPIKGGYKNDMKSWRKTGILFGFILCGMWTMIYFKGSLPQKFSSSEYSIEYKYRKNLVNDSIIYADTLFILIKK